ncbi:Monocarboxylate transporter 14, partial [Armadillidium vulgare]
ILGTFPLYAFSILFSPILMSSGVTSTKIAWIFNLHSLIWSTYTLFIGPLCDEFGWRKVAIFGGITNFISIFLSAFSPNADFLFFSFSFLFLEHRGLALGITTTANVISVFLAPIVANYLLENYGYRGGSLIFSAIILNQCVGGSLYHPIEWHMKPEEIDPVTEEILSSSQKSRKDSHPDIKLINLIKDARKMSEVSNLSADEVLLTLPNKSYLSSKIMESINDDYENKSVNANRGSKLINVLKITYENTKSLKYMRVHLMAWSYCGLMLGHINFQMWIPFVITNAGYSLEIAAWCLSLASIGNIIGRIVMSVLSDRKFFNVNYGFTFGLLLIGISIIVFSLVKDIKFYLISTCCWGLGVGSALSLHVTAIISVMGVDMLPAVFGVSSLFKGFGGISIGTLTVRLSHLAASDLKML